MECSTYVCCRLRGTGGVVGRLSGHRTVKNTIQEEKIFLLRSLTEETCDRSFNRVLRDVETPVVQVTGIEGQENELEDVKRENGSLAGKLEEYTISLKKSD